MLERASLDALFTSNNGMRAVHVLFSSFEPTRSAKSSEIDSPHLSTVFGIGGAILNKCDRLGRYLYVDVFARQYTSWTGE
jgi:hypothetical protein